jgi:hypothetical protein
MKPPESVGRALTVAAALQEVTAARGMAAAWDQFPRDMLTVVLCGLELPVVQLPELTLHAAQNYLCVLRGSNIMDQPSIHDRQLFGLLHVGPPSNTVFVRDGLSEETRNYILAHELGHFLADVFVVQKLWMRAMPQCRQAIERAFSWQETDGWLELQALLRGLPCRPPAIVMRGQVRDRRTSPREMLADLVARELLAPWHVLLPHAEASSRSELVTILREQFRLPRSVAEAYQRDLVRAVRPPPDAVGCLFAPLLSPSGQQDS